MSALNLNQKFPPANFPQSPPQIVLILFIFYMDSEGSNIRSGHPIIWEWARVLQRPDFRGVWSPNLEERKNDIN